MAMIKEAWAKLTDAKRESGVRGHEFVGGQAHKGLAHDPMTCPHCNDIRAYGLAVLERMLELRAYTCSATCDHHEDYCPRPHVKVLRAEIEGG